MMWYAVSAFSGFVQIYHRNVLVRLIYPVLASFLPLKEIDFKKEDISKTENLTKTQDIFHEKNQTAKKLKEKKINKIHSP